ncbi:hypothetical protein Barb4_02040 [Bacteroidales bacterium Barb4]|nr:hypothetical protein Barb4_02040 [Bacteroidales bacterium Barb4]
MLHGRPEGTGDFSPTCSEAECGVKRAITNKVLKERLISAPHEAERNVGLKEQLPIKF